MKTLDEDRARNQARMEAKIDQILSNQKMIMLELGLLQQHESDTEEVAVKKEESP